MTSILILKLFLSLKIAFHLGICFMKLQFYFKLIVCDANTIQNIIYAFYLTACE